jgi:hypothetical protein
MSFDFVKIFKEIDLHKNDLDMALLHKHSKAKLLPSYLNLSGNLGVRST